VIIPTQHIVYYFGGCFISSELFRTRFIVFYLVSKHCRIYRIKIVPAGEAFDMNKYMNIHKSFHSILIYIQQDATLHSLFYLETALHVSRGTTTHHQERKQLYLQHLVFVTSLLLSATIVEELELV
jgi:hypothetical protein